MLAGYFTEALQGGCFYNRTVEHVAFSDLAAQARIFAIPERLCSVDGRQRAQSVQLYEVPPRRRVAQR